MARTRVEKFKNYRQTISSKDGVPVLKTPSDSDSFSQEAVFFKAISHKKIAINVTIIALMIAIAAVLVVFGIQVFK